MSEPAKGKKGGARRARGKSRSLSRLGAIQALYQMDRAGTGLTDLCDEFEALRLGRDVEGREIGTADGAFFRDLVTGVVREQRVIDPQINSHLASGWQLTRLDSTLRAILRAGAYELRFRTDVPPRVVLDEYVELAHAFFEGEEPGVVNAVLDKIAHAGRAGEMAG